MSRPTTYAYSMGFILTVMAFSDSVYADVIYENKLVDNLPGPEALYDADQGQPQSLMPEPSRVLFPNLTLPYRDERLAFRQRLYQQYGLTYALSYQQLTQYSTNTVAGAKQKSATGGWFATGLTWTPLDRDGDYQGSLVARAGWRGPVGNSDTWPAPFGPLNMGSAWSSYEFTSWNSQNKIEDLFWEQRIGPDFSFRVGNQAPQATINTFRFKDARTGFTASPLAFSETIPYPAFGAGLSFRWRPGNNGTFIHAVLNDMNGNPSQGSLNWSHIQSDQLFAGVEVGKQWRRQNGEYDQLSLLVFHAGTRSIFSPNTTPNQAGGGFKLLGEKQWGRIVSFASYTYNEARGGGISTTFSGNTAVGGVALLNPFGINGEVAVAGMWSKPFRNIFPGSGQRDQTGVETYWNLALTPNITLTPGIQFIFDPSFNPGTNFVVVPAIKFRLSL